MENLKAKSISHQKKEFKKLKIDSKTILTFLIFTSVSCLLGQGSVFGEIYPFGFALIMTSPGIYSFSALVGTSIGFLFTQSGIYLFRYLICSVTLWLFKTRVLNSRSRFSGMWFLNFTISFLVCALTGIAVVLPTRGGFDEILDFTLEAVMVSFFSFFYKRGFTSVLKKEEKFFSLEELPALYISFATLISSLSKFYFRDFSPAIFLSCFFVLIMAHILTEKGGTLSAVSCGVALMASSSDGYNSLPLIFAGIIAGIFSPFGKIGTSVSFLLSFTAISIFIKDENTYEGIITALVASLIFIIIPEKVYKKVRLHIKEKHMTSKENTYRQEVSSTLSNTANAVTSICEGMNKVSENLKKIDSNLDRSIFCRVKQEVCDNCENCDKCWRDSFQYTLRAFEELSGSFRKEKSYSSTPFGKLFLSKCKKPKDIQRSLTVNLKRSEDLVKEEIRQNEKRILFADQMKCMCDILRDFSNDFSKCSLVDNVISLRVKEIFTSFSISCTKALAIVDPDNNMTIKAYCKVIDKDADRKKLKEKIEEVTLRKFSDPEVEFTDTGTCVYFRQKPWMQLRLGKIQLSSEESPICGDCFREFSDKFSNRTIILSDGMGTGGRAAVDAALSAEYFGSLIQNSVSFDNALKIVNSVLELKSVNESLSTIDVAEFNLFSGKVQFYKAGAAVSFVRKNGKCSVIESASLPAGILRDVTFAKESVMLSKGDIVVMVSDGVTNYSLEWIINEIENFNHSNPDILAQKIAGTVCDKSKGERRDDITVVVGIMTA